MPLARIRTRRPQDAAPVSEFLIARGYSIELVDPAGVRIASSAATNSAAEDAATPDLDINVEHCSVRDAMERAAALADSAGITAFVAPGVLEPHPAPLPVETLRATSPETTLPEPESSEPTSHAELSGPPPGHSEGAEHAGVTDALASVAGSVGDALSQTRSALTESFAELREQITRRKQQAAEVLTAAEHEAAERARSGMEAWNRRQAEQRAAREEQERQRIAAEREQRRAAEAAAQMRREREADAARRREAEAARQREGAVAAQREVELATARQAKRERARQVERAREQRLAEQRALAEAARQRELAAARAPRIPEPRIAPRAAANPHRMPHLPNRTAAHGHWRGAFTGAAALAVLLMIAWAAMSDQRPAATPSDGNTVVQQVPFGPVKLAPARNAAAPKPVAPARSQSTAPRATTQSAPSSAPARPRRPARNSGGDVAEDEVIVHHYGPTTPAQRAPSPVAQAGPRRISDQ